MEEPIKTTKYHVELIVEVITDDEESARRLIHDQIVEGLEGVHDIENIEVNKINDELPF